MGLIFGLLGNRFVIQSILITAAVASVWYYVRWNRVTIENLRNDKARLTVAVEHQKNVIEGMERDFNQILASRDRLSAELIRSRQERDSLRETLFRETQGKKGLEELARAKPGLIERAINSGTRDVLNCLQTLSSGESCE